MCGSAPDWGKSASPHLRRNAHDWSPLGAVHVRTLYDGNDACIPMLDIEGNEFCIA
ncbi:hypothetical protein GCM10010448_62670 [Streptomyces glomeratus]|uniref:Uncharacterized protein n=1 Tax=Streptomyces glomeratus TaxID=284452 RepID=A0ABP6M0Z2_9ACTN